MTNILILSAGTRDKVVQYFKKEIAGKGRIIATDCSNVAPAIYDADKAYIVSPMVADGYIDEILEICKKEKITGLFSLIDPELSLLALNKDKFEAIGVTPIVSPYELCETCLDKYEMYKMLCKMGIPTAKCYVTRESFFEALNKKEIEYPVFVKPQKGSTSININSVSSDEEVNTLFDIYDDLMIQEYMHGQEYGADVYIDMISGKCDSIFLKKKIKMRAGETDKSVSVKEPALFTKIADFVEKCGFRGMIDIDLFLDKDGVWYLSEVNPRFGGGFPHAYGCGVNTPLFVINNLEGKENTPAIGDFKENVYMMKYNEVLFKTYNELENCRLEK